MAKTLLQLINEVGKNVRLSDGDDYTTINQDADAVLINQFINQAKAMVESERQWEVMRKTITFTSSVGTEIYDLSDLGVVTSDPNVTNKRSKMLYDERGRPMAFDVTVSDEFRLQERSRDWVIAEKRMDAGDTSEDQPIWFAQYPSGDGITIEFPYEMSAVRDYSFEFYVPQADLAASGTELQAPERPVVLAATALFVNERGEQLGMDDSVWWSLYRNALSEEIIYDMNVGFEAVMVPV